MSISCLGWVLAIVVILFGIVRIAMGLHLVSNPNAAHCLGSDTTGERIDRGTSLIVFGIVLGVLVDISKSVAANRGSLERHSGPRRTGRECWLNRSDLR